MLFLGQCSENIATRKTTRQTISSCCHVIKEKHASVHNLAYSCLLFIAEKLYNKNKCRTENNFLYPCMICLPVCTLVQCDGAGNVCVLKEADSILVN